MICMGRGKILYENTGGEVVNMDILRLLEKFVWKYRCLGSEVVYRDTCMEKWVSYFDPFKLFRPF